MQEDVSVHKSKILSEPAISCFSLTRWNSDGCSLTMVTGRPPLMLDEDAGVVIR